MSETPAATAGGFKPKKSVALSGTAAGNTALCTVGRSGNDLHYRGYDILDVAAECEFEEIAHLLVHGKLPTASELKAYKTKLKSLRGLPAAVKSALEQTPAELSADISERGLCWLGDAHDFIVLSDTANFDTGIPAEPPDRPEVHGGHGSGSMLTSSPENARCGGKPKCCFQSLEKWAESAKPATAATSVSVTPRRR